MKLDNIAEGIISKFGLSGVDRFYFPNGKLLYECRYKNGVCEGLFRRWNIHNDQWYLWLEFIYKNGKWDGICREFDIDGELKGEFNYKNGELVK